ncbi:MAG: hypothetical protein WAK16_08425, partial [Candidatus Cybelea sp.]
MKGPLKIAAPLIAALAVAACSAGGSSTVPASGMMGMEVARVPHWLATHSARPACSGSRIGQVQCDVLIENKAATPNYVGVSAAEIEAAYK